MKNVVKSMVLLAAIAIFAGCQSSQQKAIEAIKATESEVFSENGMIDQSRVDELIEIYMNYAHEFPDDTLAPDYLFKAGDIAMNTNRSNQALKCYDEIISNYTNYQKSPEALFLKGYVYENNLGRLDKARAIYEEFIVKYPNNEFADDAAVSLKYLGKSPEELIEIFQQENAPSQN